MQWLWILGVLLLFIFLFLRTRIGIFVTFQGKEFTVQVRVGLLRLQVIPKKKRRKRKKANKKEKTRTRFKLTYANIRDAIHVFSKPLQRALKRIWKSLLIHPCSVCLILGGRENPDTAAQTYGYLHSAVGEVMPILEQAITIKKICLDIKIDFNVTETQAHGKIGVYTRIGTLLTAGVGVGIPLFKWLSRVRKQSKSSVRLDHPAA